MDRFIKDILDNKQELKQGNFKKVKAEILKTFSMMLPYEYKNGNVPLSDFNVAFLGLYHENASMLRESYISILQDNLTECYKNAEEDHLTALTVEDDLSIHSIIFPIDENQTEWEISYEMDLDDTIFHVYFEGWRFKTIEQTH